MALMALREQLDGLVNSMFLEGLLDDQFEQLQMLQDESSPGFIAELITLFCGDSERILAELTKLLDQAVVDYQKVDAFVHQLKGSSSSVGAQHVKLACVQFRQFCEEHNKEGLSREFKPMRANNKSDKSPQRWNLDPVALDTEDNPSNTR
ncbi:histidine-containing phosphotransfer protein [Musa troglodytarum]|uniref:Histidine-containing phosphotransfer protein n=1 Tax=Musa troglodytarum TaxID=320322 RepID=A0A9E7JIC8_9LILI|nr:histidine-containing phosphotransfer protein [Musa troglodytarum]